jgi:uncharacterized Zn finger protein
MSKTSKTWWGQSFITALEKFIDEGRLTRGRAYGTDNRVKQWDIKDSKVSAKMRGNVNPYFGVYKEPTYNISLSLTQISSKQWDKVVLSLGENAGAICKLMMNEMPDDIEQSFKAASEHLLPTSFRDFQVSCSCPDGAVPCKHIAGVFYRLAEQLDHDPFLLFQLRGLSHKQLHKQLAKSPLGEALLQSLQEEQSAPPVQDSYFTRPQKMEMPKQVSVRSFWQGDKPRTEWVQRQAPSEQPSESVISALLIKKGGDYPPFWDRDNSFIEAMEAYYLALRKNGQKLL